MRNILILISLILIAQIESIGQSYGLIFNSHEVAFEKRTSLDLSPRSPLCFSEDIELSFDLNFIPQYKDYYGYIIRIIGENNKNIDLLYNYKLEQFKVVIDEKFTTISFSLDSLDLYQNWSQFKFNFDLQQNKLQLHVNDKLVGNASIPPALKCFRFYFGTNDSKNFGTKDLPPMQLKDIRLSSKGRLKYYWPLDEITGDSTLDKENKQVAIIKNALWKRPKHQKWELANSFFLNGYCAAAYNSKQDKIFIIGSDSLAVYSLKTNKNVIDWISTPHLNLRVGNQAIYDTISNKLYNFYIDQKNVVSFDFENKLWKGNFADDSVTAFWHANKFISPLDSCLYIIGGYGYLKYKNVIRRYSFRTKIWEEIAVTGDYFSPRFLAALGPDPGKESAYIVGGFGSYSGDQMLGAGNVYDLLQYNVGERSFKKIYNLKGPLDKFTFANSLIIDPKSKEYYGLIYPNDSTNSNLQVVRGNFTDSILIPLGNPIPFRFHDTESFTDLYYSESSHKLIAVVLQYIEREDHSANTDVKIYTIDYPPLPDNIPSPAGKKGNFNYLTILLLSILIAGAIFIVLKRKYFVGSQLKGRGQIPVQNGEQILPVSGLFDTEQEEKPKPKSSINLFGQFQAFDKKGNDITVLFSPLQKELFLLITINTISNKRGIWPSELDHILWSGKSEKDAKNNRSVNITRLRAILDKIGNCTVARESGFWQFKIMDELISLDYKKYSEIIESKKINSKEDIATLIDIVRQGSFLYQTDYDWLDNIKSEVSNTLIGLFLEFMGNQKISNDPEFIIKITNRIFDFDHLNEEALAYKCRALIILKRRTLANNIYLKFLKDYKDIYGTDFSKSFQEITQ